MKTKIQIKTKIYLGSVLFEYEKEGNTIKDTLEKAVKTDADLEGADLRGAKNLSQGYIDTCCQQMLYIFEHTKKELPFLKDKLLKGEVDGTQYEGNCACLIGSLANAGKIDSDDLCSSYIPFYTKGLHNPAEQWFWQIKKGDTPENNEFAKKAPEIIDMVLNSDK